ncbi:hypothetical protein WA158_005313 [Blastocystis sp. Blastoise]
MGCCASKSEENHLEVDFKNKRKCTDPICCCVFILFWFILLILFFLGLSFGQPENIIYGLDYNGHACGDPKIHPGATEYNCTTDHPCKYVYYPRLSDDAAIGLMTSAFVAYGVCLPKCPVENQVVCSYEYQNKYGLPIMNDLLDCTDIMYESNHLELCSNCWITPLNTTSVIYRCIPVEPLYKEVIEYCNLPKSPRDPLNPEYISPNSDKCLSKVVETISTTIKPTDIDVITKQLASLVGMLGMWVQDIQNGWLLLLIEALLVSIAVTLYCYMQGNVIDINSGLNWIIDFGDSIFDYGNSSTLNITVESIIPSDLIPFTQSSENWTITAYVLTAITLLVLVIVCALGSMVGVSEKIIKEATHSINTMPILLFCPILVAIASVIVIAFFIISTTLLVSSNMELSSASNFLVSTATDLLDINNTLMFCRDQVNKANCTIIPQYLQGSNFINWFVSIINLFGLFWSAEFISGIAAMTISGAIAKWYFTRTDKKGNKPGVGNGTVLSALSTTLCCCHCCLWCLEKCLRYISRNAYILVITRNKNFCTACVKSFTLLAQNLGQVTLLNGVTIVFLWLGKLLSAVISGISCFYFISIFPSYNKGGIHEILDPWPLTIISILIGYVVFSCFTQVYNMGIDTILLCYCEDTKFFKEKDREQYADEDLKDILDEKEEENNKDKKTKINSKDKKNSQETTVNNVVEPTPQ